VKITHRSPDGIILYLTTREADVLLSVLKLYPRIPPAHQRLSRKAACPDPIETQRLLDEALAEQRAENKKTLERLLEDPERFGRQGSGFRISLSLGDLEWMLQILNDVRVGSWVLLESPEEPVEPEPRNAGDLWAMDMSGYFQMQLLRALEGRELS
jgi:hypothetical protein